MNITVNGYNVFLIMLVTFISSLILVPISKQIAIKIGAMDEPNYRKVHKVPMPRLGGLAIFLSFLIGYIFFGPKSEKMIAILIGSFLILLIGIIDDISPVQARYKLIIQIIASLIIVYYGNIYFEEISIFGLKINFGIHLSKIISTIFIIAITNAINLIDGLDGLAAGISLIYFITISIIAFILNHNDGLDIILCLIMIGSTLGFLVYNFPPATIFMGDSGSQFLGFIISIIALLGFKTATVTSIIIPITILAIPIIDTIFAILRRLITKQNIGHADKEHFHHQLLKLKYSPKSSILIIYSINIVFALISIFYTLKDGKIAIILYSAMLVLLLFIVMKTDILFEHHKKSNTKKEILTKKTKNNLNNKKRRKHEKNN